MGLGVASALVVTVPAEAAQLQSWWFNARENQLVFTTDAAVQPRAQLIFNPTRIVIDLPGTTLGSPPASRVVGGAIREIRSGQFNAETARLVIELNPGYSLNPRAIQVRGQRRNRWIVQLPEAEQSIVGGGSAVAAQNTVEGQFTRGTDTLINGITTTPDGFFIQTRGTVPQIRVERQGNRDRGRQIAIEFPNTAVSPLLRAEALPQNRYSITGWRITQNPQTASTRITATLGEGSPDWEVASSRFGGVTLVPPAGVSINDVPDQVPTATRPITVPRSSQERPAIPTRPRPPGNLPGNNREQPVVVLDPGHGGVDPGAVGIGGLQEKTIVLPMSLRVAELLRAEGVQVIMTRSDDLTLDLEPRVNIANRANATVFLSIHANAISLSRPDVNGVETYYASESGRQLANIIHANVLPASGLGNRGVKQARFFVLRHTDMPAALLEVGFVTGREDAPRLQDPRWRERTAQAIAQGLLQYLRGSR